MTDMERGLAKGTSTLTTSDVRSGAALVASADVADRKAFLRGLSGPQLKALPYLFDFWALDHQLAPEGDWRTWVILWGRGAGKTRAGSEWVRSMVEGSRPRDPGVARRVGLIGETMEQAREVMVFGESGILACSPPDRRPTWIAGRQMLVWPNGAEARLYSAFDPERLRGPQFDAVWADEVGCAAVDKGTNEPNRFVDLKSSESGLPRASNGIRDDYIQMQYLRTLFTHYKDPALNPTSPVTGLQMVDPERIHVWAWDARPFPAFPANGALWSDNVNYSRGHWINGRAASRPLSSVVAEICEDAGVTGYDVSALHGAVRGYGLEDVTTARSALQPLMVAYGFDAIERDGVLVFRTRGARMDADIDAGQLVYEDDAEGAIELTRSQEAEVSGRVRVGFVEADADYEIRSTEATFPDEEGQTTSTSELSLVLTSAEGQRIAERWLSEARVARDTARFTLPPSLMKVGAGDVIRLPDEHGDGLFRIDQADQTDRQALEAVRIEPAIYEPQDVTEKTFDLRNFVAPVPVELMLMELPLLRGDEDPVAPYVAASGVPWPGSVALYSATQDAGYGLNRFVTSPSTIGLAQTVLPKACTGLYDRGPALRVQLIRGDLQSISLDQLLGGANSAAIGDGSSDNWEVFQFAEAEIVDENTFEVRMRLRGQAGTGGLMPEEWPVGSVFVLLNGVPEQIELASSARGVTQHFRYGPGTRPLSDPSYQHRVDAFLGAGLRPYNVAHLRATPNGGALDVTWVRRTRLDGDSWDSEDVPLSEAFERYRVRVFKDGVQARQVTVNQPNWSYSAVMQAADGAGETYIQVAQVSETYGEGLVSGLTLVA